MNGLGGWVREVGLADWGVGAIIFMLANVFF